MLGTLFGIVTGGDPTWSLDGNLVFNGFVLSNLIGIFVGFAIAMLIMNTAGAIVAYFVYSLILPTAVGILSAPERHVRGHRALDRVQHRPDAADSSGDYTPTGEEWAQIATSGTIWLIIPLALGIWRLLRIEFK